MVMEVPGERRRGRPKRRWLDNIKNDLSERELPGEEAQDRVRWRRLIRNITPNNSGKGCGRRPICYISIYYYTITYYSVLFDQHWQTHKMEKNIVFYLGLPYGYARCFKIVDNNS